jgi:hypothetical protein
MMGRQTGDQSQLFYLFNLERRIPAGHLLRRINPIVTRILMALREKLAPFYSEIGRPSIDPELMLRMLIVGYCYGERRLCEEVEPPISQSWRRTPADITARLPMRSTGRHGRHEQLPSSLPGSMTKIVMPIARYQRLSRQWTHARPGRRKPTTACSSAMGLIA